MTSPNRVTQIGLAILCMATLTQCSEHSEDASASSRESLPKSKSPLSVQSPPLVKPSSLIVTLWQSQQPKLDKAINTAEAMQASIEALLTAPTAASLNASQQQWLTTLDAIEALALFGALARSAQGSAWQSVNYAFEHIAHWPAKLGYLDDNGVHGKTGLIFDLDTPINTNTLRQQHGLTDSQDATLGLYPLGLMLWGANGSRNANDFGIAKALSENHRVMGYTHPDELPSNRRRQLIQLQAQLLVTDLKDLKASWERRDRNSALNAISQPALFEQRKVGINAGLSLAAQQMLELKSSPEQRTLHAENYARWVTQRRNQRWLSQLASLEEWLTLMDLSATLAPIEKLRKTLADSNALISVNSALKKAPDADKPATENLQADMPDAPKVGAKSSTKATSKALSSDALAGQAIKAPTETEERAIESQLSAVVLKLKQSLAQISTES